MTNSMNNNIINNLNTLGLTKSEAQIYLAILELGQTNVSKISHETDINRRNVYDSLSTLLDKGLIFQIIGDQKGLYSGVNPEKLMELVHSKEMQLEKILPEMRSKFNERKIKENAIIYKGIDGFKNYLENILENKQNVYCLGAKGGWSYESLGDFVDWFASERIRHKIKVYNLFDNEMKESLNKGKKPMYSILGEQRFLPKEFSTNSAVDVFGDQVVTFTGLSPEKFENDVTLFVIQSKDLAESWKIWFQFMWNISK